MNPSVHVLSNPGEAHVLVLRGGRLIDYALWRPGTPDGVGDLHRGRVVAVAPAMAGTFVALAHADGFLPDSEGGRGLTVGTVLAVRVTRAAQGGKGPRLTARLPEESAGAGPVGLLRRGPDPVERLAVQFPDFPIKVDEPAMAADLRQRLGSRVSFTAEPLDDGIAAAIEELSSPVVELSNGARLSISPTPALVAIDVDAGGAVGRDGHHGFNRAVLPCLARQIRLRNLSGAIVVDLAGLSIRKRAALASDFVAALDKDPLKPRFLGFTALGLAEIMRPRVHPPLHELQRAPLAAGLAGLRAVWAAWSPDTPGLPVLRAHPVVVSALQDDGNALQDLQRRTGCAISLRSDPSLTETGWVLEKAHG